MTSKVKGQGHKVTSSVRLISASFNTGNKICTYCVIIEAGGAYCVGRTRGPHFLFYLVNDPSLVTRLRNQS